MKHPGHTTLESMNQAKWYNRWTLQKFRQYLLGEILEIGCGIGNFTETLLPYGAIRAIDIENHYIHITQKRVKGKALVGKGDIEKGTYFFKKRMFDTLVCLNVLEHIEDDTRALQNMYKITKPGGHLVLLVPAHMWLYGSIDTALGHYRRYDKKTLCDKLDDIGYTVVYSNLQNMLGAIGWLISGKLVRSTIVNDRPLKLFDTIAPFALTLEHFIKPPFGTSVLIIARKS